MPATQTKSRADTLADDLANAISRYQAAAADVEALRLRIENDDTRVTATHLQEAESAERFAALKVRAAQKLVDQANEYDRASREESGWQRLRAAEAKAPALLRSLEAAAQGLVAQVLEVYALQVEQAAALDELNTAVLGRGQGNAAPADFPVHSNLPAPVAQIIATIEKNLPGGITHPRGMALSHLRSSAAGARV